MKISFPHPIIILLGFILLSGLATYFVDSGSFERTLDEVTGREILVPGSFEKTLDQNVGIFDILLAIPEGIIAGADILVLILLLGGAFYVIEKTGALQEGIEALIYTFRKRPSLLLYILGVVFATCGAVFYMSEEIIALVPILVLLSQRLKYDVRSIVAMVYGAAIIGAAFSPFNPFASLLAMKIAEVDPANGAIYRMIFLVAGLLVWVAYHVKFGKLEKGVEKGLEPQPVTLSRSHQLILLITLTGIGTMIWGVVVKEWDYNQMGVLFFVMGFLCGLIGGLGLNGTAKSYSAGFGEMIFAGVIVGLARSVYLVLEKGQIIDPLIQALFQPLESLPAQLAAVGMVISQGLIHIPVPSSSGQAVLTMPLVIPLTDLLNVSREIGVLSYQYSATLMDLITPTNGTMMAIIAAAGIKYNNWIAYLWKSWLLILGIGLLSVLIALFWFS